MCKSSKYEMPLSVSIYSGKTFLTDPWLMDEGALGVFADSPYCCADPAKENIPMPMCDLPMSMDDILRNVDAYIVTHIHPDHIDMEPDGTVGRVLDKNTPAFVQNTEDAQAFLRSGFTDVTVLYENSAFDGVRLIKTPGRHGTKIPCGPSCVLFSRQMMRRRSMWLVILFGMMVPGTH